MQPVALQASTQWRQFLKLAAVVAVVAILSWGWELVGMRTHRTVKTTTLAPRSPDRPFIHLRRPETTNKKLTTMKR